MGCQNSTLSSYDDPVKICKDMKRFIKQAVKHKTNFASAHISYIQSLRNVSHALTEFIQGDNEPHKSTTSYLMASGTRPVQIQETPPKTYKVEMNMNMNPLKSPHSPWSSFWSFDFNRYNCENQISMDDDEIRRVREKEGIPDLEEDDNGCELNQEDEVEHVKEDECKAENERDINLNQRPTSMREVMKDLEDQFGTICAVANEVSSLLEANKVKCVISEKSCHQGTLDRLYVWEKTLYDEVKSAERVRIAYEKKRLALRNHDVKRDEASSIDKTRVIVKDLHTQMQVYIHSIESISAKIETLRDQELLPQILDLFQRLVRMWKVMAECHQIQKRTLEEAKRLFAASKHHKKINTERLAGSALNLVAQLRNWRACFQQWIKCQRSYVMSLTVWFRCHPDAEKVTLSTYPHLIVKVCIGWSTLLNGLNEKHVVDNLDFFASCISSLFSLKVKEESYSGTTESMELVEADKMEKMAEIAVNVVCHGMSVAVSSLAEFAKTSADEHSKLVNHPEDATSERRQDVKLNRRK